jgi:protein O-mannosyl-transferase
MVRKKSINQGDCPDEGVLRGSSLKSVGVIRAVFLSSSITHHKDKIGLAIILLLTTLLYVSHLPEDFTNWDDPDYITENPWIRSLNVESLNHLVMDPFVSNQIPLTMLSYAVDYQLWELNSVGYHLHNLALHLICVVLVYYLLVSLKVPDGVRWMVVSLFALHPTNVESILWASERKNLLGAMFFLISFLLYVQYHDSRSRVRYILSIFCYLLSLFSKVSAVTAVAVFLGYDLFIRKRKISELNLYEKLPYLIFAEVTAFWTINAAQIHHSLVTYHKQGFGLGLFMIPKILGEYITLLLFPVNINVLYLEHTQYSWSSMSLWVPLILMVFLFFFIIRQSRSLFFWLVFFLMLLLPVLNIVPLPFKMANRYLYIPQIGIWVVLGFLVQKMFDFLKTTRLIKGMLLIVLGSWSLFLLNQTLTTVEVWKNSFTLWSDSIEKDFNNAIAHTDLGFYIEKKEERFNLASSHYYLATRIAPELPLAHYYLGIYYTKKQLWDLAADCFHSAIQAKPDFDLALNNLGGVYYQKKMLDRAELFCSQAVFVNPNYLEAWDNLFFLNFQKGNIQAAREIARQMILRFPESGIGQRRMDQCP